ncbi:MAG: glycosyltransferase [Anaerolineae bacterium]
MTNILLTIYILALMGLGTFGFLGYITLWYYWLHRDNRPIKPALPQSNELPNVTIQLPVFNEQYVIKRLIDAAVNLDYPTEKLHIQVVDDSTDTTQSIAAHLIKQHQKNGVQIEHVLRQNRTGYKAGALDAAIEHATGEFIAIFDADFQPPADFLKNTIPYFIADTNLGMVQTRWGHLNDQNSFLTAAQAMAMDKHFVIEQTVRHRADFYPKFNGTAGIWRKSCVVESGGWQDETVCEDLCLSTRAILQGWDFTFLPDVVTPGELPTSVSAYKNQQARWAKGSLQCLLKYGWKILTDSTHSLIGRIYALITMSGYLAHPFLIIIILSQIPFMLMGTVLSPKFFLFSLLGLGQPVLFVISQQLIYPDWRRRLRHFPTLMLVSLGLGSMITRALIEIFTQKTHRFVRTPKGEQAALSSGKMKKKGEDSYQLPFDWIVLIELGLSLYGLIGVVLALITRNYAPIFLMGYCMAGYGLMAWLNIREHLPLKWRRTLTWNPL